MTNRIFALRSYKYGFNGKESDNEIDNSGDSYNYGMRFYNSKLGKFLSLDPLSKSFPYYSPYQYAGNTPIQAIDLDGLEPDFIVNKHGKLTRPMMSLYHSAFGYEKARMMCSVWIHGNTRFNAQTIYTFIIYGHKSDRENFESDEQWVDYWLNLSVHEHKHRDEYGLLTWPMWAINYGIDVLTTPKKEGQTGKYNTTTPAEERAYGMESPMVDLMNFEGALALKTLESNYDEKTKIGLMKYVGKAYNLQIEEDALNAMKAISSLGILPEKAQKRLNREIKNGEKRVNQLSSKVSKLRAKYGVQIAELDSQEGRKVQLVTRPTK